jgi:flagellar protein FlaI
MLNSLSMFIPPEKKIVSIEDVREINIPHENWIPATSRTGFGVPEAGGKRYGEVQLFDLLKESFRMKPDYVIVGEVRGKEAYVLFQGMASGNPSLGTIHSGSVEDVIKRLQTPPIELSPSLIESLDVLIIMVNARERGKSARRVKEVVEIESMDTHSGKAHTIKPFAWIPSADDFKDNSSQSLVLRRISFERGIPYNTVVGELQKRKRVIEWMQKFNVVQFEEVSSLLNLYHKEPETIMEWVDKGLPPYKTKTRDSVKKLWQSSTGLAFAKESL